MFKRIGFYSAALFATLALAQFPAASAQNRDGNGRDVYAHQTSAYNQSNEQRNSFARQSNQYSSNDRGRSMLRDHRTQFDVHRDYYYGRDSERNRRGSDRDDRWER